jgi:hypothetical protein
MTSPRVGSATELPPLHWWDRHAIDVVALVLGMAANLRVWLGFFAVRSWPFAVIVTIAASCEVVRRIVHAGQSGVRPRLFSADRRFDLIAALFLMSGPDPIALSAALAASPRAWWQSVALPQWLAIGGGLVMLAVPFLLAAGCPPRSHVRSMPRLRDLAGVPDVHAASLVFAPAFTTPALVNVQ